jgi:hypothetical protein
MINKTQKMKPIKIIVASLAVLLICGCISVNGNSINGSGVSKTQEFNTSDSFSKIEVSNSISVEFTDQVKTIKATGDEKVLENLIVNVSNGTLSIRMKNNTIIRTKIDTKVFVPYFKELSEIKLSGASEFLCEKEISSEIIKINMSGASELDTKILNCDNLYFDASGASDASFKGQIKEGKIDICGASQIDAAIGNCQKLYFDASGASEASLAGKINEGIINICGASELNSKEDKGSSSLSFYSVKGEISGASEASFKCDGDIKVSLSGASQLCYFGDANTAQSSTSGASSIKQK